MNIFHSLLQQRLNCPERPTLLSHPLSSIIISSMFSRFAPLKYLKFNFFPPLSWQHTWNHKDPFHFHCRSTLSLLWLLGPQASHRWGNNRYTSVGIRFFLSCPKSRYGHEIHREIPSSIPRIRLGKSGDLASLGFQTCVTSVLNRPAGLPRALDGTGRERAVRSRPGNLGTAGIVKDSGP